MSAVDHPRLLMATPRRIRQVTACAERCYACYHRYSDVRSRLESILDDERTGGRYVNDRPLTLAPPFWLDVPGHVPDRVFSSSK